MAEKVNAALYIRLSKEDDRDGPSESITNQRAMLEQYAAEHHLPVGGIYVDDGWSGCNFDRPDFRRMLADIEAGRINTVITKDLSRLGRDYILTGHYLERYFPEHNVRYISLLDGIDTHSESTANDITPFRAIMNDMYARDISRKITSVKRDKQKRGLFIGGKPMFGYQMHPTEKNHIVIDDCAAAVVRRIFSMALAGTSCRAIAAILNEENIPSPSVYAGFALCGQWSGERISEMLRSEVYLGNMVQGRRVKVSYKSKKSRRQKEADWIVVKHTHDAIIDRTTFDAVQRLLASRRRTRSRTYDFPLKGLVFCHECGHPLGVVNRKNSAGEDCLFFLCRTYQRDTKKRKCSPHCVKVISITDIVMQTIFDICLTDVTFETLELLALRIIREAKSSMQDISLPTLLTQQRQITAQIDRLCSEHLQEMIMPEDFSRIYQNLCQQRDQLNTQLQTAQQDNHFPDEAQLARELTSKFLAKNNHDRDLLTQLIDRIELTEHNEIVIHFCFVENTPPSNEN